MCDDVRKAFKPAHTGNLERKNKAEVGSKPPSCTPVFPPLADWGMGCHTLWAPGPYQSLPVPWPFRISPFLADGASGLTSTLSGENGNPWHIHWPSNVEPCGTRLPRHHMLPDPLSTSPPGAEGQWAERTFPGTPCKPASVDAGPDANLFVSPEDHLHVRSAWWETGSRTVAHLPGLEPGPDPFRHRCTFRQVSLTAFQVQPLKT